MCADRTTYSFFSAGSVPGNLPMTLADSTSVFSTCVMAFSETASGNRGSGLRSLPSAAISANVWPEPAKSFSALAGLNQGQLLPAVSFMLVSASSMLGGARFSAMRDHGRSIEAGLGNATRRLRRLFAATSSARRRTDSARRAPRASPRATR